MLRTNMFDPSPLSLEDIRKLSRHEYDELVKLGMFDDERVELLRGMLVTMSPQGGAHAAVVSWLAQYFTRQLDESYDVRAHSPFAASDDSEPEPDVSIARRAPGVYTHPETVLLLIEVAASSITKDRAVKAPLYGEVSVPEYWLVDLTGDALVVSVYTRPSPAGYRHVEIMRDGDLLRPTAMPGLELAIASIPFPR